ncbi:DNA primase [Bacillus infantis]|uniref:DNA primase n=1 Tax=Bacillus infantis TaxID=324767 RepID=UPI003CEC9895
MSEFQEIKKRIHSEEKIEDVLELLGCWSIGTEQGGKLYVAGLPDGDNPRSVQIKNNEKLSSHIRSKGIDGDIYDIVSYIIYDADTKEKRDDCLPKSKFWICQKLNYQEYIDEFYKVTSDIPKEAPKYNSWLSKLNKKPIELPYNKTYAPSEYERFQVIPYKKWYEEGLNLQTQKEFQVGIDVRTDRVTFAIHNKNGELIGVKGRYCGKDKQVEDQYKYLYLIPCNKSIEFFNLHRALPYIQKKKEVIVVEGGKTTMFLYQWKYPNSISIEGDSLSDFQVHILKGLGLDIKFIFAYDKDKDAEFIVNEAAKLTGRMKYGIFDRDNLLEDKDSPTDKGKQVWEDLYNNYQFKLK